MARTQRAPAAVLVVAAVTIALSPPPAGQMADARQAARRSSVADIPFVKWVLANGLTVIVHEDHRTPFVCVGVTYHVGSQNEPPGRRGFAHLFEHLFEGGTHSDKPYGPTVEALGASKSVASTYHDRTVYGVELPSVALERVLWLEADRMGFLANAIDESLLKTQREMISTERAMREAAEDVATRTIAENTFPAGHPYSWWVQGEADDLARASMEDVRSWFQTYYGPSNATLVVSGDVSTPAVRKWVDRYFGGLPPGPPITRKVIATPQLVGAHRQVGEARVAQSRLWMVWNVPAAGSRDAVLLGQAAHILAGGDSSRLVRRFVRDLNLATRIDATVDQRELASQFGVSVACTSREACDRAERELDREIARFRELGPTLLELELAKSAHRMMLARASERIGYGSISHAADYAGKADILSRGQVLHGRPDAYKQEAEWIDGASPHDIRQVTRRWLTTSVYKLRLDPFAATAIARDQTLDRSQPPPVSESASPPFPTVHAGQLQNGMRLRVVSEPGLKLTRLVLVFGGGVRADPPELSGLTSVVMTMLAEGTQSFSAAGIRDRLDQLGTKLDAAIQPDASSLGATVLSPHGGRALALLADLAIRPLFGTVAFELAKARAIAKAEQELRDEDVNRSAFGTLTGILYGRTSRYARPLSGSGDPTTLGSLTREDLRRHQRAWLTPNNATLIAVGPLEIAEIRWHAERAFGQWQPGTVPPDQPQVAAARAAQPVRLIDHPRAQLSQVVFGTLLDFPEVSDAAAFEVLTTALFRRLVVLDALGAYGRGSAWLAPVRGERPWGMYALVPSANGGEAARQILAHFREITETRRIDAAELETARQSLLRTWAGWWADPDVLVGWLADAVALGFSEHHYAELSEAVRRVTLQQLNDVASTLRTSNPVLIVVGDRTQLEPQLRELRLGDVRVVPLVDR